MRRSLTLLPIAKRIDTDTIPVSHWLGTATGAPHDVTCETAHLLEPGGEPQWRSSLSVSAPGRRIVANNLT
jgi:hypothetical protein